MKTHFLAACLFCFPSLVFSQTYRTFPLGDASWMEGHTVWFSVHVIEYSQQGDTLVPGHALSKKLHIRRVYSKNWANPMLDTVYSEQPMLIGALSQDTVNRRVYYTAYKNEDQYYPPGIPYDFHPKLDTTLLLYDFDLGLLEKVGWAPEPRWFFESKPLQLKDGSWSRSLRFLNESFDLDTTYFWIEGVGGVYGLFTPLIDSRIPDASSSLGCFSANGVSLFPTSPGACEGLSTSVAPKPEPLQEVYIFPNPASDRVFVELDIDLLPAFSVLYDAYGRRLATQELTSSRTEIPLGTILPNSLFFIQTTTKYGRSSSKMFIRLP